MKKRVYFFMIAGMVSFIIMLGSFGEDAGSSSGAPAGNTNSPGDGQNCTHCMGGTATAVTGWITSNVPAEGYKNDSIYTITVTATGVGNKGFEVSPQDLSRNLIGTLFAGTGNKLVGSGKYVTHNAPKTANPSSWDFTWKAPSTGNDDITFYGAIAVTKPVTKTTTLTISKNTVGLKEQGVSNLSVYPNPFRDNLKIEMQLPSSGNVLIELLNLRGAEVALLMNEFKPAGSFSHQFTLNQPSGIYLLRIKTDNGLLTKKLIAE